MTAAPEPSPFAAGAPSLRAFGFRPIPVLPPTGNSPGRGKAPGEFSMGRWHGMQRWQRFRDADPTKFEMDLWDRYPDANVGVVLGNRVGDLHVIAIDVDATDPDELRDILGALPHSPMVKRAAKGETRLYLTADTVRSTPYDGPNGRLVDLLTGFDCRQTIMPPSRHPDGPLYQWLAGPVAAADLPEFTADDLAVLEETLSTLGWVPKAQRRPTTAAPAGAPRQGAVIHDVDDIWTETKVAALANMEAWVHDLDVHGLRPARNGYEAVATWRASSTGQAITNRKRNLSIQPEGIRDFGVGWTGSAIDLVMEAQGIDQAAATSWLRTRLGLTGEVIVLEQRAKASAPVVEIPEPEVAARSRTGNPTELPDHLTRVPGLVGGVTDWIVDTARRPQRGLALGAALALVGTAAGRKVAGPTDSGTHLYVLALARTGAGKDHPLKCIGKILTASSMAAHKGPAQFMSMSALVSTLADQPLTLSAMDEFGSFLKRINGAKSSPHERAISGMMRTAWGSSFSEFETPAYAQSRSRTIISPAFSIYGASTAEEFFAGIEGADVFNGFLNRFLIIGTNALPPKREPLRSVFEIPETLIGGMLAIYNIGGPLLGATSHNGQSSAPTVRVPWADEQARRVYERLDEDIEEREADAAYLGRTSEMALRMATIRAIGISATKPQITVADMEWGRDVALWSAERMIAGTADYMAETPTQVATHKVLRIIKESGKISRSGLLKKMQHTHGARDVAGFLKNLEEAGQIVVTKARPPSGGPEAETYMVL